MLSIARRTFIAGIIATPLLASPELMAEPRTRRSIERLDDDDDDLLAFKEGIRRMRARSDSMSLARQTALHARFARHGDWMFLPWHRLELLAFEAMIARVTDHAAFALPYWDYNATPRLPAYFFNPSDPLYRAGRKATADTDIADLRWRMNKGKARFDEDDFTTFSGAAGKAGTLEAFGHNLVHAIVGGDMAQLDTSPLDPIFYLHHANIDRAWASWLDLRADEPIPAAWKTRRLRGFVHPARRLDGLPAAATLDIAALGYQYDNLYGAAGTGPPVPVAMPPPPDIILGPDGQAMVRPPPPALAAPVETRLTARPGADPATLSIALPDAVLAPVRAGLRLTLAASGSVGFAYDALDGASLTISGGAPAAAAPRQVAAVPVVLHGHHDHRGAADRPASYAFLFDESEAIESLIRDTTGALELSVDARDLTTGAKRGDARPLEFDLAIRLRPA